MHPPTIDRVQTQATCSDTSRPIRTSLCLFGALSCLFLILARGRLTSIDEWHVYGTTESLVERGSWRLQIPEVDREYSRYSLVPSLLGVPFYLVVRPIVEWLGSGATSESGVTSQHLAQAAVSLETPLVTAATAALLFFFLCRLRIRPGPALATAMVFSICTLALPYSGSLYVQPLAAFALLWLVGSTALDADRWRGVALAVLGILRLEFLAIVPLLLLDRLVLRHSLKLGLCATGFASADKPEATGGASGTPCLKIDRALGIRVGRGIDCLVAGVSAAIGLNILVNMLRGDHWLLGDYSGEAFSTPLGLGLWSLLFASGKGLLWFAPAAAVGLGMMPWLIRRVPRLGFLAAGVIATQVVMVACWWTWHGGWSWGPRLLVPLMPLLVLPFAWFFQEWAEQSGATRTLLLGMILSSFAAQVRGLVMDPVADRGVLGPLITGNENESIYIPQVGPWGVSQEAPRDLFLCRLWKAVPDAHTSILVIAALLAVGCLGFTWASIRTAGIKPGVLRAVLPRFSPLGVFAFAVALLLLGTPTIFQQLLSVSSEPGMLKSTTGGQQFRAFAEMDGIRVTGSLYAPLRGAYTFYRVGPPATQFNLDGLPLFQGAAGEVAMGITSLEVGFHKMEIMGQGASPQLGSLYWTTPGNAHYKELIPRVYLARWPPSWPDRIAIWIELWKWLFWIGVAIALLLACTRPDPTGPPPSSPAH